MDVLRLSHVSKSFGKKKVIKNLSFTIPEHTVFGFIGTNGAGKTTAMQLICGLLQMDNGEIFVCGEPVQYGRSKTARHIGYLPDVPQFYDDMTPFEYLFLCGQISRIPKDPLKLRILDLLKTVHLKPGPQRIKGFSRGMKQRLGIAQALLHQPRLLICDEPTSALDPVGRKEILNLLSAVKKETSVLFSTHVLSDVERICDHTALLHHGKIAFQKTRGEIKELREETDLELWFCCLEDLHKFHRQIPESQISGFCRLLIPKKNKTEMLMIMEQLVQQRIPIEKIERIEPSIENFFFEIVKSGGDLL